MTTKMVNGKVVDLTVEEEEAFAARILAHANDTLASTATVNAEAARQQAIKNDVLCSVLVTQLKTATAAQIASYVDNNVTDLASARVMLKRIVLVLARLLQLLP